MSMAQNRKPPLKPASAPCHSAACGQPLFGGVPFCPFCGERQFAAASARPPDESPVSATAPPVTPRVVAVDVPPRQPQTQPPQQEVPKPRDPIVKPVEPELSGPGKEGNSPPNIGKWALIVGCILALAWLLQGQFSQKLQQPGSTDEAAGLPTRIPTEEEQFVSDSAAARTEPSLREGRTVLNLTRGMRIVGIWFDGEGGGRWFKITQGGIAGAFVSGNALSSQAPPVLVETVPARANIRTLSMSTAMYEAPSNEAPRTGQILSIGSPVEVRGKTPNGWWEINTFGRTLYIPPETIE